MIVILLIVIGIQLKWFGNKTTLFHGGGMTKGGFSGGFSAFQTNTFGRGIANPVGLPMCSGWNQVKCSLGFYAPCNCQPTGSMTNI